VQECCAETSQFSQVRSKDERIHRSYVRPPGSILPGFRKSLFQYLRSGGQDSKSIRVKEQRDPFS
jgi:hypothetical protein